MHDAVSCSAIVLHVALRVVVGCKSSARVLMYDLICLMRLKWCVHLSFVHKKQGRWNKELEIYCNLFVCVYRTSIRVSDALNVAANNRFVNTVTCYLVFYVKSNIRYIRWPVPVLYRPFIACTVQSSDTPRNLEHQIRNNNFRLKKTTFIILIWNMDSIVQNYNNSFDLTSNCLHYL